MKLFTHVILAVCFFGGSSCLGMEVDPTVAGTAPAPTPLPVPPVVGPYMRTMKILTEATGKGQADLIRKQLNEKGEAIFNAFETALSSGESYTARDI